MNDSKQNQFYLEESVIFKMLMLTVVILMGIASSSSSSSPINNDGSDPPWNISKCYKLHCYYWNGRISNYSSLKECTHPLWNLEIYDEQVEDDVTQFIVWQKGMNMNAKIGSYYIPLDLKYNQNECVWTSTNRNITFSKYIGIINAKQNGLFCVQYSDSKLLSLVHVDNPGIHTFVKICMGEIQHSSSTEVAGNGNYFTTPSSVSISKGIASSSSSSSPINNDGLDPPWNIYKCYKFHCYYWNGRISNYSSLKECTHPLWNLEIYDEQVEKEVTQFIKWQKGLNMSATIGSYYILLDLKCNQNECIWTSTNRNITFSKYIGFIKKKKNGLFCVQYSHPNLHSPMHVDNPGTHTFVKICMREIRHSSSTKVVGNGNDFTTPSSVSISNGERSTMAETISGLILVVAIGGGVVITLAIFSFLLLLKRKRSGTPPSLSSQKPDLIVGKEATVRCEVEKCLRGGEICRGPKEIQYANLEWVSSELLNEEETNSDADVKRRLEFLGPRGDVYAMVEKI